MIFKSYLIEQNFQSINTNLILFFGENIGLKNEFKKKIKSNNLQAETITFFQDDIIRNEDNFFIIVICGCSTWFVFIPTKHNRINIAGVKILRE